MKGLVQRHPVASYFFFAIALSWSAIAAIVFPGPLPASPEDATRLFPAVYLAMLVGPSVTGILVTALTGGRSALREYRERLLTWRVGIGWYAMALFTAPASILIALLALSVASPQFLPAFLVSTDATGPVQAVSTVGFVVMALTVGVGAGFFEELGWTGVAVPRLLARHGVLATGIGVGLVWGVWHFFAIYWGSADVLTTVPAPLYLLVALFSFLPPYRVLMTWVYDHTRSLFIGILMHISLTTSMILLGPAVSGGSLLIYDLAVAVLFWVAAAVALLGSQFTVTARVWRSDSPEPQARL